MKISLVLVAASTAGCAAFAPRPSLSSAVRSSTTTSTTSLSNSLRPLYDELLNMVGPRLGLQTTDYTPTTNAQTWQAPTAQGTADWFAESNPQYLTGVTAATRMNAPAPDGSALKEELTVNVWMGPSFDIPHLLMTFGEVGDGSYHLRADYVARGATAIGSDPQYLETYYGADVQAAWLQTATTPGVRPLAPSKDFNRRLLDSPVQIAVAGLDYNTVSSVAKQHVERWIQWLDGPRAAVPARLRGSFNLRDDKLRQFYFRGECARQVRELGETLGPAVAAANTGPTAEAYVGGGS